MAKQGTLYQKINGVLEPCLVDPIIDTALSTTSTNAVQNKVINTALAAKAADSNVVHKTGDETINGIKEFNDVLRVKALASHSTIAEPAIYYPYIDKGIFRRNGAITGFIQISLPRCRTGTFLSFIIYVQDDSAGIFEYHIKGYQRANNTWAYCDAYCTGVENAKGNLPVRFCFNQDKTQAFITIGEPTTTWSSILCAIYNITASYIDYSVDHWATGWSISMATVLPDTVVITKTNPSIVANKADKATTLAGYGITDAKIANGTITLGSNSITIPASATVDNALSSTSTNPVQNKVINTALGTKANDSDVVKLTGDQTIAGAKTFSTGITVSTVAAIKREVNNDHITFYGCTGYGNGAYLTLYGKDAATDAGKFTLRASDGTNNKDLTGKPDGTLTWNNKDIAIDEDVVHLAGAETITGTKTFTANSYITKTGPVFFLNRIYEGETPTDVADIRFQNNGTSEAVIRLTLTHNLQLGAKGSGANWYNGPALMLNKDNTFSLRSGYGGTTYALVGSANGTLTWVNKGFVYDSGDQTITGQKTLNTLVVTGSGNLRKTDDTHDLWLCGGIGNTVDHGAYIGLYGASNSGSYPGFFSIATGKVNNKYAQLLGNPDGTLTWGGKGFVYTSGNQTIAGNKTFSATSYHSVNQIFKYAFTHGTNPSSWTHRSIYFSDSTGGEQTADLIGMVRSSIGTNGATRTQISAVQNVNTSPVTATLDVNTLADGTVYATCPMIRPTTTNAYSCGSPTYKWTQVYATSATINTSDERLKSSISSVPDAVLDAWNDVNWAQFQFNDAIAEKGIDKARIHNGLIAQYIDTVFKAHGLDASRYGLFCYDKWDAIPEEKDEDGNIVIPAIEAGDAYSLRYEEALCMEAAYQRRRADRAEARITALEEQIAEIKSRLEVK